VQNLSYEIECDLHENEPVGGTHFHIEWSYTKTHFGAEAKGNSEVAY